MVKKEEKQIPVADIESVRVGLRRLVWSFAAFLIASFITGIVLGLLEEIPSANASSTPDWASILLGSLLQVFRLLVPALIAVSAVWNLGQGFDFSALKMRSISFIFLLPFFLWLISLLIPYLVLNHSDFLDLYDPKRIIFGTFVGAVSILNLIAGLTGLYFFLSLNGLAYRALKQHGYKVGLLGGSKLRAIA